MRSSSIHVYLCAVYMCACVCVRVYVCVCVCECWWSSAVKYYGNVINGNDPLNVYCPVHVRSYMQMSPEKKKKKKMGQIIFESVGLWYCSCIAANFGYIL